ncbi:MAG: MFS transporter [Candidatus Dormibacteria bacterium]
MKIAPARQPLGQAFGSLRSSTFRWWFASQVLSASGSMTQGVAQAWLVLKLTGSGLDLGLLGACYMVPVLVGGPWAGTLVDRVDRRRLLIATQSLFLAAAGVVTALTWTGAVRVWMLFVVAAVTGAVSAPDGAARQVYVLDLVGGRELAGAVSLNEVVLNVSRVVGPAVGGVFLATLGIPVCYLANGISYLPPLLVLLIVHRRLAAGRRDVAPAGRPAGAGATSGGGGGRRGGVRSGLRYVWRSPLLRTSVLMAAAAGMLFNLGVALPLLATRVFHLGGGGYGLMMAAFGVGGIGGALLAAVVRGRPDGREVRLLAILTGLAILGTALAPGIGPAVAGMVVTGCLSIWFIARANTLVQLRADPAMRGRVMGIWTMALPGAMVLTGPATGMVAGTLGARAGFGMAGVALLLATGAGWQALAEGAPSAIRMHRRGRARRAPALPAPEACDS